MTQSSYLLNTYSNVYLAVDPTASDYGLRASSSSDVPLAFTFTPIASTDLFKICTTSLATPYCLDVYGNQKTTPHLSQPGDYSGQQWSIVTSGTGFKLSNAYTGPEWFLDVYGDTKVAHMTQGDYQGQYWTSVDAGSKARSSVLDVPISTPTSTLPSSTNRAPTTTTSQAQAVTSTIVGQPASSVRPATSSSSGLSTRAERKMRVTHALPAIAITVIVFSLLL